jgi:hypothetical protein
MENGTQCFPYFNYNILIYACLAVGQAVRLPDWARHFPVPD